MINLWIGGSKMLTWHLYWSLIFGKRRRSNVGRTINVNRYSLANSRIFHYRTKKESGTRKKKRETEKRLIIYGVSAGGETRIRSDNRAAINLNKWAKLRKHAAYTSGGRRVLFMRDRGALNYALTAERTTENDFLFYTTPARYNTQTRHWFGSKDIGDSTELRMILQRDSEYVLRWLEYADDIVISSQRHIWTHFIGKSLEDGARPWSWL